MTAHLLPIRLRAGVCTALLSALVAAQAAPDDAKAAAETAAPAAPAASSTAPATGPGCRSLTDQALAADLKAASAQSQRQDIEQVAALYEEAVRHWRQAAERCEDRARERALRNLEDSRKAAAVLQEQLGAGPQCAAAHKDAAALQDLAKQASGERRWQDASILYRKAESMWDLATERCGGSQLQLARQRREQSEVDGHNAEFCAPVYERARERTQRMKTSAGALDESQRRQLSQESETLWRDAAARCRGAAQDLARTNAQAVVRERGTPWVPTSGEPETVRTASAASTPPAAALPSTSNAPPQPQPVAAATGAQAGAGTAAAPKAPQPMPAEFTSGDTRYAGQFTLGEGANGVPAYSGQGRLTWANGDVFEGLLVRGQRHGQGRFVWANGQQYEGEWMQDRAQGRGRLRFANGDQYEGTVVDGVPEGNGRMGYASGDSFSGQFVRGMPAGRGEYVWRNGQRYEGPWHDQQPHGVGTLRFANGNLYEGALAAGMPHGQGRMRYADGDVYTGAFISGLPEGQGRYEWKNGDHYVGAFKQGRKQGRGTLVHASGGRWEGEFDEDEEFLADAAPAAPATVAEATPEPLATPSTLTPSAKRKRRNAP